MEILFQRSQWDHLVSLSCDNFHGDSFASNSDIYILMYIFIRIYILDFPFKSHDHKKAKSIICIGCDKRRKLIDVVNISVGKYIFLNIYSIKIMNQPLPSPLLLKDIAYISWSVWVT